MLFKFGVIADTQYSDEDNFRKCRFRLSKGKLADAVATLNTMELDFVVQLGDFINRDFSTFDEVLPILDELNCDIYSVLGNHDLCVEDDKKRKVFKKLTMPFRYYSQIVSGWKLIFLDGNDISLNAFPEGSEKYLAAEELFNSIESESKWWNGAIGGTQLQWLENELITSEKNNQNVIIFCHFPITPDSEFTLWNRLDVLQSLNRFKCVKFWMNGHHHEGAFVEENGRYYVTFKGMVETESNSFATVEVYEDKVEIHGFGREDSRVLNF